MQLTWKAFWVGAGIAVLGAALDAFVAQGVAAALGHHVDWQVMFWVIAIASARTLGAWLKDHKEKWDGEERRQQG